MTISEAIKHYNLERQTETCFGDIYPEAYIHYHAEKDTPQARYIYHADNEFSADMDDGKTFILDIQRISKHTILKDGTPLITGCTIELSRE